MRVEKWLTDEPCVFDGGEVGFLTRYRVEAVLQPGEAVELYDDEGSVSHRFPAHPGTQPVEWVGEHIDRRARLDARIVAMWRL